MHFCFEHTVPLAREKVFAFFENPKRLEMLHAGWSKMWLLRYETKVRVGAETWVEVTLPGFVPMVLGFRHFLFEPPFRFGEEAIHGPFSRFVHIHEFGLHHENTLVRDLLEVCLPRHYGAETAMKCCVAPAIKRMFYHRAEALTLLGSDGTISRYASTSAPTEER